MQAYNSLEAYRAAKVAAADAKRDATAVIAAEGTHTLPEHCDKAAIRKVFTQLSKANPKARAILDDLDGAKLFADAEAERQKKRDEKARKAAESLKHAIDRHIDKIIHDDKRRALLMLEVNAAEELSMLAAQAAQSGNVEAVA